MIYEAELHVDKIEALYQLRVVENGATTKRGCKATYVCKNGFKVIPRRRRELFPMIRAHVEVCRS